MTATDTPRGLTPVQIEQFVRDGYVAIPGAFARADAEAGRRILWAATGCDPDDRATWTKPVIRLGGFAQPPFDRAANSPVLHRAFDQLVGEGRWEPRHGLGGWPVRFPSDTDPGDTGWHVDASFAPPEDAADYLRWRVNWRSRDRALLMLFLFSDVGPEDAPTRIRAGSHRTVARLLRPHGDDGLAITAIDYAATADLPEAVATGEAGTVFLCHPFLVHAAQPHRGTQPKFMAQPPLLPRGALNLDPAAPPHAPLERAIIEALV
jgi:hypothetical protein